jgi:Tfp pilus assembly protein PilW
MKPVDKQSGFSLMELVIGLMLITVVTGVSISLLNRFQTSYRYEEAYADAQRNARFALSRLNEIIRSAGTNPTGKMTVNESDFAVLQSPTISGTASTSSSIRLKSDLNGDTANNANITSALDVIVTSEDVTLRLDSVNRRIIMDDNTTAATDPMHTITIADNIISLSFTDPNGSTRTNKTIIVNLVAVPNGIQQGDKRYREVAYSGAIRLRNR